MKVMFLAGGIHKITQDSYPLYLAEFCGNTVLEKQVDCYRHSNPDEFIFCVKADEIRDYQVDLVIKQIIPNYSIVPIKGLTKGAVCTALLGSVHLKNDGELIIASVDDFMDNSCIEMIDYFRKEKADVGVVSFDSVHPRYSFAKLNDKEEVVEVAEKRPISKNALASFYYFKSSDDFIECAKNVIRKNNPINGSFYISQVLNEMILRQGKVAMYKIPNGKFHPLKTEMQLAQLMRELEEERNSK